MDLYMFYEEHLMKYESDRRKRRLAKKNDSTSNTNKDSVKYEHNSKTNQSNSTSREKKIKHKKLSSDLNSVNSSLDMINQSLGKDTDNTDSSQTQWNNHSSLIYQTRPGYLLEAVGTFSHTFRDLLAKEFSSTKRQAKAIEAQLKMAHLQSSIDGNHRVFQCIYDYDNQDFTGKLFEAELSRNCATPYSVYTKHDDYIPEDINSNKYSYNEDNKNKPSGIANTSTAGDGEEIPEEKMEEILGKNCEGFKNMDTLKEKIRREIKVRERRANYAIPLIKLEDCKKEKWSNIID